MQSLLSFFRNTSQSGKSSEPNSLKNDNVTLNELAIRKKELELKEVEIKAQIDINRRNLWISSPFTVAIIGLFSAGIASLVTSNSSLQLETKKIAANVQLERQKFEFTLIEKSLETKDKKEAAKQLLFLVNSGVIQSLDAEKIRKLAETPEALPLTPPQKFSSSGTLATIVGISGNKNLRSGPGTVYGVVGTVQIGDRVQILGTGYDSEGYQWYQVYHPKSGTRGWIASQLINPD